MTLDAAEVAQITEIAQRTAAEAIRNIGRGTGGANLPIPEQRLGTCAAAANAGDEVSVRADGDVNAVPVVNATGHTLQAGDRVMVSWFPPLGVYATALLTRVRRGSWSPNWAGPSAVNTNLVTAGWYFRDDDVVTIHGKLIQGAAPCSVGTALTITGLPFPIRADGDSLFAPGLSFVIRAATGALYPLMIVGGEGDTTAGIYYWSTFAAPGSSNLASVNTTGPITWAQNDTIYVSATYRTDAA